MTAFTRDPAALVIEASRLLGATQSVIADITGCSRRTVQRWTAGTSSVPSRVLHQLARLTAEKDRALASELALAGRATLELLGIAPIDPPARSPASRQHLVDAVVCAGADAASAAPEEVRAVVLACLVRAREVGLTAADVEEELRVRAKKSKPGARATS